MIEQLHLWGLTPERLRTDIKLPGSPERCVERWPVEDDTGQTWMLERLHPDQDAHRQRIGATLSALHGAGLPIPAYQPGPDGRYVIEKDGFHWQLSPYVPGDELPQPDFVDDTQRGVNLGTFIADLALAGEAVHFLDDEPRFNIQAYVTRLMATIELRHPRAHEDLKPVLPAIHPLFDQWDSLPTALCQGDFHPLNVIWNGQSVAAVIDWEFAGRRPALYDTANCLGCVGIEDPHALVRGLAPAMLATLRDREALEPAGFELLPALIVAMRFAWMSEWLRKRDHQMVDMELKFMRLMVNSLDTLLPAWNKILGL